MRTFLSRCLDIIARSKVRLPEKSAERSVCPSAILHRLDRHGSEATIDDDVGPRQEATGFG